MLQHTSTLLQSLQHQQHSDFAQKHLAVHMAVFTVIKWPCVCVFCGHPYKETKYFTLTRNYTTTCEL